MPEREEVLETAWNIHNSLAEWTGKVDVKAAFALSIESAALIAILAIATGKHRLAHPHGAARVVYIIGVAAIIFGALWAVFAVTPHIRRKQVKGTWSENFIFFGHLKYWKRRATAEQLVAALQQKDVVPMLARQLAIMGDIAWNKHRYLQLSFIFAVLGCALVGIAALVV